MRVRSPVRVMPRSNTGAVRTDKRLEFTGLAFAVWTPQHRIAHLMVDLGWHMQNYFIESFDRKFQAECLNECWGYSLVLAREVIERVASA